MSGRSNAAGGEALGLPTEGAGWWTVQRGTSPVLATAIHNGHAVAPDVADRMALGAGDRLREEDPFTEFTIRDVPSRIAVHRSRFEIDLNRARGEAVYLTPSQCWGLRLWTDPPAPWMIDRALQMHDQYYAMLRTMLEGLQAQYGRFVVLDVHSYNHRRDGAGAPPTDPVRMPDVNIGTFSMDRARWAHVVEPFMDHLRRLDLGGRKLDVRENVAFQGRGEQTRFIHQAFPLSGCAIAVEFKKTFMDEWTGRPDPEALAGLRMAIRSSLPALEAALSAGA